MKILKSYFVLKNKTNNKFFAIDSNSGGYPYSTEDIEHCKKFKTSNDLNEFLKSDYCTRMFKNEIDNTESVKINIGYEKI